MSSQCLDILTWTYAFSTVSSVGFVGVPSCLAFSFLILLVNVPSSVSVTPSSPSSNLFICTVNVISFFPPLAGTVTSIPDFNSSSEYSLFPSFIFPTNVVPVGISSLIVTFPSPSPLFVAVSVYVIVSFSFKGVADASLVFLVVILATFVSTLGVSVSATFAAFFIAFVVSLLTVTTKDTSTFFPASIVIFSHVIVFSTKFPGFVISVGFSVPSGTTSEIVVTASTSEVFSAVIIYLTFWPTFTVSSFFNSLFSSTKIAFLDDVNTGVLVLSVSLPFTFAVFSINSIESEVTFTLKETLTSSPALTSFSQTILWISFPSLSFMLSIVPSSFSTNSVPAGTLS